MQDILHKTPVVLNIGLSLFSQDLDRQNVKVAQVNWTPSPAFQKEEAVDAHTLDLLADLL